MTDASPGVAVFIYFKADTADDAEVLARVSVHQQALAVRGVTVGVWRRIDEQPIRQTTWMETYAPSSLRTPALLQLISDSAAASGLALYARGPRHVEVFESVAP